MRYQVGAPGHNSQTLRGMLSGALSAPLRRLRRLQGAAPEHEQFWALKDISFEIERGSIVRIIGANGAGKRTLLKPLSRILHPLGGRLEYRGRRASLPEDGTGVQPALTGIQHLFLGRDHR